MQEKEIQLIFDPGKGSVDIQSIHAYCGDRIGTLPKPQRRGYVFKGWYTQPQDSAADALRISSETVVDELISNGMTLYAYWEAPAKSERVKKVQNKKSSLSTQKKAVWITAILTVLLIIGLIVVKYVVDIYSYVDTDGTKYTIKKSDGLYGLYYDGKLCDINEDGYYLTRFGNQLTVNPETGEYQIYAIVDVEGTEQVGVNQRVLMFKQLTYDASSTKDPSRIIQTIDIENQHGHVVYERGQNSNDFVIKGHESAFLNRELFAQLSNGCGYTISQMRLENPVSLPDGSIDLAEYGLAPEVRTRTDEEGNEETYDYTPNRYTITTLSGDKYSVILGDATVSGAGYYAMYEGRDKIYILSSVNLDAAVLQPGEALVTPMIIYPMSMNTHFNVSNFTYRTDIDYERILVELVMELTGYDISDVVPDPETGKYPEEALEKIKEAQAILQKEEAAEDYETANGRYEKLIEQNSHLVTAFTYIDLNERENTLDSTIPYLMASDYMEGYFPNSDNISQVLYNLYSTSFNRVVKLGPSDDELYEYGLEEAAHILSFTYTDASGQQFPNYVQISERTEDGVYYAYSPYHDMIVEVAENSFAFLEWKEIDWYEREYFLANIAHCQGIKLEGAAMTEPVIFELDNSKSDQSEKINSDNLEIYYKGKLMDYSLLVTKPSGSIATETANYNFRRFYQALLTASVAGTVELTEEEMAEIRKTPDEECQLKLTILLDDGKGTDESTRYAVYRFYQITERKSYMTIELLDSPESAGNPENGQGIFYVSRTFCDKLIADAYRFINEEEIVVSSKN